MPIFKITIDETITRKAVAYVEAPDASAADAWSGDAPDWFFKPEGAEDLYSEVNDVEEVSEAPERIKVHVLAAV